MIGNLLHEELKIQGNHLRIISDVISYNFRNIHWKTLMLESLFILIMVTE